MKCTLDGGNARIIAKAFQSLSKFGADLFVEADQQGMQLRSLNPSRSAVGTFRFNRNFFVTYQVKQGDENYCRISMKACLTVFRNMKQVEQCEIQIIEDQAKFQVQLKCRLETVKTALISILDEENIAAAVTSDDTSNVISGSHKIFTEISNNFNAAEEEITIEAHGDSLTVKNYVEGSRVNDKFMRSQLKLAPAEFETYEIEQETAVTFCLREFRAFLSFAETLNENMVLHFYEGGSPVFLKIKKFDQIECILIMSTLSPEDVSFYEDCRQSNDTQINNRTSSKNKPPQKRKQNSDATCSTSNVSKTRKLLADETTLSNTDSLLFQFGISTNGNSRDSQSVDVPRYLTDVDAEMNDDDDLVLAASFAASVSSPQQRPPVRRPSHVSVTFGDTGENNNNHLERDDDCIPQSPQRPKLRSIFSRCFQSTYVPKEPSPNSQVYVPDSDTDD